VVIVADRDTPGLGHAAGLRDSLLNGMRPARSVAVVGSAAGNDSASMPRLAAERVKEFKDDWFARSAAYFPSLLPFWLSTKELRDAYGLDE
jgi:hypothetical protein